MSEPREFWVHSTNQLIFEGEWASVTQVDLSQRSIWDKNSMRLVKGSAYDTLKAEAEKLANALGKYVNGFPQLPNESGDVYADYRALYPKEPKP